MTPSRDRYSAMGPETEFQPGSRGRVLKNKPGISSIREMGSVESKALLEAQSDYLLRITTQTTFTTRLICQMHRDWLGGVYEWAGSYRTVNVSKEGFAWPPAYRVPDLMAEFERGCLAKWTPCRGETLAQVATGLAIVHAEFLLVHPFREGNGRLARWVGDLMAMQAGYSPPNYSFIGRGSPERRAAYLHGVKKAYAMNYAPLTAFFEAALRADPTTSDGS